ncbi:MAG: SIS domain-containing protein [Gammaproteobacteria bacterium]|nr:SIS domain-containing protein [Gammaproteobacteria bacterium]MDH5592272.1 SIS domain-containing protein [Gammaproteobacteria bacterium]
MSFKSTLIRHQNMVEGLFSLEPQVTSLIETIALCLQRGNKVLFFGNGGSASDAQHLAAEFVVRYHKQRLPLAAIALTTDTSIITAHGNDFSFDTIFDRQIQALAKEGDIAIGLSTSGNSSNVMNGLNTAKKMGCWTCAFTGGTGGQLLDLADECIRIPCNETARIQEGHIIIGHWLCEALDERLSS